MKYLFSLLLTLNFSLIFAQEVFVKTITDVPINAMASANDLKVCPDSGYIITGLNFDTNNGAYLIKTNSVGDTLWTRRYPLIQAGLKVFMSCSGEYVSIGENSFVKVDSLGSANMIRSYYDISIVTASQTNDCGYMLAGSTQSFGAGGFDILLIRADSSGLPTLCNSFGGNGNDYVNSIFHTSDDNYLLTGFSESFSSNTDSYIIKIDSNGNIIWSKTYASDNCKVSSATEAQNGNYVFLAPSDSGTILFETDTAGNLNWSKSFRPTISGYSLNRSLDGGYIFTTGINYPEKIEYIKTDISGNLQWNFSAGGENEYNYGTCFMQSADSGYVLLFYGSGNHFQRSSFGFLKTNLFGMLNCGDVSNTITVTPVSMQVAPVNSVSSSQTATYQNQSLGSNSMSISIATFCSTVDIENPNQINRSSIAPSISSSKNLKLEILSDAILNDVLVSVFDINGHTILTQKVSGNKNEVLISIRQTLMPGMYFIRLLQKNKVEVIKFIII